VADRLNEAGHRTRKGKHFGKDTIDDMLRNPFYTGKIVYGTKHKGQEPEIFEGSMKPSFLWTCLSLASGHGRNDVEPCARTNPNFVSIY